MLISKGEDIDQIYIVEQGIIEVYMIIGSKQVVIERLFRGSIINFKNIFRKTQSKVYMRFAVESVVKSISIYKITEIRQRDKIINRAIEKFELKAAKIPIAPLDYILVLPKKVYMILIDRTREKMLFSKQD